MLESIALVLIVLWLLGLVSSYTMGGVHPHLAGHRSCGDPGKTHPAVTCLVHSLKQYPAPASHRPLLQSQRYWRRPHN